MLQWLLPTGTAGSSAVGSAQRLGRWGRRFKSCLPDQNHPLNQRFTDATTSPAMRRVFRFGTVTAIDTAQPPRTSAAHPQGSRKPCRFRARKTIRRSTSRTRAAAVRKARDPPNFGKVGGKHCLGFALRSLELLKLIAGRSLRHVRRAPPRAARRQPTDSGSCRTPSPR